jgi:acyl-CoA reductase-like NAD-dependent aldehyde dehydrogenase
MVDTVEIIRPSGEHRSRDRAAITDVTGATVAELGLAPGLLARRIINELDQSPDQPEEERLPAISRAGHYFAAETLDGETPEDYCRSLARVGGLPLSVGKRGLRLVAGTADAIHQIARDQRPGGASTSWRDDRTRGGRAVWMRRGRVLAFHAGGNHPAPHTEWLIAIGLGYRVAVRPSRRDPFTPRRLIRALDAAGLHPGHRALLPTTHHDAESLLRAADLGIVYGGDNVTRRYEDNARVLAQGPGRSKILITADTDWQDHLDVLVEAIARDGGTGCINTTAILVEGDPRPLAKELALQLGKLAVLPPEKPDAALPVLPLNQARAMEQWVRGQTVDAELLTDAEIAADLGDGSAALRPAVFLLGDPFQEQVRQEMPFPCVWVAPWSPTAGVAPLRESLVVTLLTGDRTLMDACVAEPSIRNVYWGDYPTCWLRPGLPHDGYFGEFLMRVKTVAT